MKLRSLVFLVVLAVVIGVGVALWRGSGPLPDPEGCSAQLAAHRVELTTEQGENAALIAAIGVSRGLPARAVSIALATAYQESKIRNLTHGDRDSLGLFQQRPSQGWGTTAAGARPLLRDQQVLRRAGEDRRLQVDADHRGCAEGAALGLSRGLRGPRGRRPGPRLRAHRLQPGWPLHLRGEGTDRAGQGEQGDAAARAGLRRPRHGPDRLTPGRRGRRWTQDEAGVRLGWSVAQFLVAYGVRLHPEAVAYADKQWRTGRDSEKGWVPGGKADEGTVHISMG